MEILELKNAKTDIKNLPEDPNRKFKMEKKNSEIHSKSMEIIISVGHRKEIQVTEPQKSIG